MSTIPMMTNIGFSDEEVPVGTHMCLVYTSEHERTDTLLKYLLSGLKREENTACISGKITEDELRSFFRENGISYDERKARGQISLSDTSEVYFKDGIFDPDRTLQTLAQFYLDAKKEGFPAARIIGDMIPEVSSTPGGERLLEYESRVSILVRTHPITAICQYDACRFDGKTIMEIFKVHPKMIVNGSVVHNPFFIEPEEYLKGLK